MTPTEPLVYVVCCVQIPQLRRALWSCCVHIPQLMAHKAIQKTPSTL